MPAARDTEVGALAARGAFAPMLSTLMMRPHLRSFICGMTRRQKRTAANSFSSRSSCSSASDIASNGPAREVPALLTMMSTLPNAAIASS